MEGEIVEEADVMKDKESLTADMADVSQNFAGEHTLPVSAYSAIKVDGVPMYKRARKAEITGDTVINIPMRTMVVHEVELLEVEMSDTRAVATIRFVVASGTYIRSLAEELGREIGYPACLQNLRRTKVGEYRIEDSQSI